MVFGQALHLHSRKQLRIFVRENWIIRGGSRTLLGHMNKYISELGYIHERGVHTSVRSSQTSRRNASCARASREEDGLPSPRHSTSGSCDFKQSASRAFRRSSVKEKVKFVGRRGIC